MAQRKPDAKLECSIDPSPIPNPLERIAWMRPPELPGVQLVIADNTRSLFRMFHTTYTFATVLRGDTKWTCNGTVHRSGSSHVAMWEPGDFHACLQHFGQDEVRRGDATTTQRGIILQPWAIEEAAEEAGFRIGRLHFRTPNALDPAVHRAMARFHEATERPGTVLEKQTRFAQVLRALFRRAFVRPRQEERLGIENDAVDRARRHIEERFADEILLEDLAQVAGLNRFHLLRAFKKRTGVPPHRYQIEVRISRARELLDRRVPPALAAASVGFSDQSHFTRHFQRIWRVKPGQYFRLR